MDKNDFAPRPPMGWNSYDYYDTAVTEQDVKANADYMAAHLKQYGWEYIIVDIAWYAKNSGRQREQFQYIPFDEVEMDAYARLQPVPERFPSSAEGKGFLPLAEYVHQKGLKFGIHIMRGIPRIAAHLHMPILGTTATADQIAKPWPVCEWNPDMYGVAYDREGAQAYYDSLFKMYAQWGVDYVKVDDICNTKGKNPYEAKEEIELIHKAIVNCGRPIVLSLSPGPALLEQAWHMSQNANMWRITDDFWDNWELLKRMFERCEAWQYVVRKGCWPDCDMLPLGWIGKVFREERQTRFTKQEQITMMNLWCIFRSPLMLGAEMTRMDEWTYQLLTKEQLIRAQQFGQNPTQLFRNDGEAAWYSTDEENGAINLALFNLSDVEKSVHVALSEIPTRNESPESIWDIWKNREVAKEIVQTDRIEQVLPPHGSSFMVIS